MSYLKKIVKPADVVLTVFLFATSIIALFFIRNSTEQIAGEKLYIYLNGDLYGKYSLKENKEIKITKDNGDYNIIKIEDGSAKITQANCTDKICTLMPPISLNGQNIICLPHKLVMEIKGKTNETDAVVR